MRSEPLVGEKQQGTAAWVLSKPVTRTAFVVSRLPLISTVVSCVVFVILAIWRFYRQEF